MDIRKTAFYILTSFFLFLCARGAVAQDTPELIPVSGVVVDRETLEPIPNVTIKNSSRGASTLADSTGFFNLTASPGDTLIFEAMLYRKGEYIVPEGFSGSRFAIIEALQKDKVLLEEVTVRAFPTQQQFERAFLSIDPDNLTDKTIALDVHLEEVTYDPTNMQQYILDYNNRYVTYIITGEVQPNNFLNPFKWSEFIRDWKDGVFTEDAVEKLHGFPDPDLSDDRNVEEAPILLSP